MFEKNDVIGNTPMIKIEYKYKGIEKVNKIAKCFLSFNKSLLKFDKHNFNFSNI